VTITAPRSINDGVTVAGNQVSTAAATANSATPGFLTSDVGKVIAGSGIPTGTTIVSYVDTRNVIVSAQATVAATGVALSIGPAARTVTDGVTAVGTTVTSATAAFTSTDVGQKISGGTIPANDTIASVTNATTAVLAAAATAAATGVSVIIGPRTASDGITILSSLTSAAGAAFTAADLGRQVYGPAFAAGTTITTQSSGTVVLLSAPPVVGSALVATIGDPMPVPVGTYTLTVVSDGLVDADTIDPDYTQSIISSGSTFTVADY
jgi:hypothetical protein